MPLFSLGSLRRHERATLRYSYAGEFGRGALAAVSAEFALVVALVHFKVENVLVLWVLSSAGFLGLMLAALGATQTGRYRKKEIVFRLELTSRALVFLAAFAPSGPVFAILVGLGVAVGAMGVPLLSGIYGTNFDARVRGRAVGRLQAVRAATMVGVALAAGAIIDEWMVLFRVVLGATALLGMACAWYAYRLPESRGGRNGGGLAVLRDALHILRTDHAFAYIQLVWFLFGVCNLWLIPIRVLHLENVGYSELEIMIATAVVLVASQALTPPLWGPVLERTGIVLYRVIVALVFVVSIPMFFYGKTLLVVCIGAFIWGAGLAGGTLSWQLIATFFTTRHRLPVYMSIHTFLCGVRGLLGPLAALLIHRASSARVVANISVAGIIVTTFMLLPLLPAMRRRQEQKLTT